MLTIEARTIQILAEMVKAKVDEATERLGEGNRNVIADYAEYRFYVGGVQALKGVEELIKVAREQAETEAGNGRTT